jgi:hypothetical protein
MKMTDDDDDDGTIGEAAGALALRVSKHIQPLLRGLPSEVQGAALADLLSLWLAGHFVAGSTDETAMLREAVLAEHIECVRGMIPSSEAEIILKMPAEGHA